MLRSSLPITFLQSGEREGDAWSAELRAAWAGEAVMSDDKSEFRLSATTSMRDEEGEEWQITVRGDTFAELEEWMRRAKDFKKGLPPGEARMITLD
jgi:hypothetical protein